MEHSKHSHSLLGNSGFTLIEVLIAITILSFIAFSTYRMVDSNITTKETVLREDQAIIQSVTAVARIDTDITQLYSPLYYTSKIVPTASNTSDAYAEAAAPSLTFDGKAKNGQLIPIFKSEDKSSIIFFTQANRRKIADIKESRFAWVKYSLRPMEDDPENPIDPAKKNLGSNELIRQVVTADIYNPNFSWSDAKAQVLLKQVKSAEFSFWDERTKKFVGSILDLNENKHTVRAIKLILVWVDEDNNEQTVEKNFRILHPYFNTKQDELKLGAGAPGIGPNGGGVSTPTDPGPAGADGE